MKMNSFVKTAVAAVAATVMAAAVSPAYADSGDDAARIAHKISALFGPVEGRVTGVDGDRIELSLSRPAQTAEGTLARIVDSGGKAAVFAVIDSADPETGAASAKIVAQSAPVTPERDLAKGLRRPVRILLVTPSARNGDEERFYSTLENALTEQPRLDVVSPEAAYYFRQKHKGVPADALPRHEIVKIAKATRAAVIAIASVVGAEPPRYSNAEILTGSGDKIMTLTDPWDEKGRR